MPHRAPGDWTGTRKRLQGRRGNQTCFYGCSSRVVNCRELYKGEMGGRVVSCDAVFVGTLVLHKGLTWMGGKLATSHCSLTEEGRSPHRQC